MANSHDWGGVYFQVAFSLPSPLRKLLTNRWFSRYVIAAMLMDENKRFLINSFCSSTSNCSIVICVPRNWLQTTYRDRDMLYFTSTLPATTPSSESSTTCFAFSAAAASLSAFSLVIVTRRKIILLRPVSGSMA